MARFNVAGPKLEPLQKKQYQSIQRFIFKQLSMEFSMLIIRLKRIVFSGVAQMGDTDGKAKCVLYLLSFLYNFASYIALNGVWAARLNLLKPAFYATSLILLSTAWAPKAGPFSAREFGTHINVEPE